MVDVRDECWSELQATAEGGLQMIWLGEMERGHGGSFVLLEVYQNPLWTSLRCAAACRTAIPEHQLEAGCRVPDPTGWPALAGSCEPRSMCAPFSMKISQRSRTWFFWRGGVHGPVEGPCSPQGTKQPRTRPAGNTVPSTFNPSGQSTAGRAGARVMRFITCPASRGSLPSLRAGTLICSPKVLRKST